MQFDPHLSEKSNLRFPKSTETGQAHLERDVESFRNEFSALKRASQKTDDQTLLAILSAVPKSENLLLTTVPHLIDSAEKAGKGVFLVIGCNQGQGFSNLHRALSKRSDCNVIEYNAMGRKYPELYGPFRHVADNCVSRKGEMVFKFPEISGSKHTIVICGQEKNSLSAGKSKMLDDIFGFVVDSIFNGWTPPKNLLMLDDDTRLVSRGSGRKPVVSNLALKSLLDTSVQAGEMALVGARWLMTPFESSENGLHPTFLNSPLPHYGEFESLQGKKGFQFLVGGTILGDTIALTALYRQVCSYVASTMEDFHLTAIAKAAGYEITIPEDISSANFIHADSSRATGQLTRWMRGIVGLENLYGQEALKSIFDTTNLSQALGELYREAKASPNDIQSGSATWSKGEA